MHFFFIYSTALFSTRFLKIGEANILLYPPFSIKTVIAYFGLPAGKYPLTHA